MKGSGQDGEKKYSVKKAQLRLTLWLVCHAHEKGIPASKLAGSLATDFIILYRVHPFYDGNIRTILVFFERFCEANGWKLDMDYMLSLLNKPQDGLSLKEMLNARNAHFLLENVFKNKDFNNFTFDYHEIKPYVLNRSFAPWTKLYKKSVIYFSEHKILRRYSFNVISIID